jgi:hypothetical protein
MRRILSLFVHEFNRSFFAASHTLPGLLALVDTRSVSIRAALRAKTLLHANTAAGDTDMLCQTAQ